MTECDTVREFFYSLFGKYGGNGLRLEIRPSFPAWRLKSEYPNGNAPFGWQFYTGKRLWFCTTPAGIEGATRHALQCAGQYECYFGVLPRNGKSGKGADVPAAACLWADIDGGDAGHATAEELLDLAVRSGSVPEPNWRVVSGGGLHVYWNLREPIPLESDEDRRQFKELLKRLCGSIGGESPAAHADFSRADVASILRVPGTFNRKRETKPRCVRVSSRKIGGELSALEWRNLLPALPIKPQAEPKRMIRTAQTGETGLTDPRESRALVKLLLRWAQTPYPEGLRHKSLTGAAVWLIRDLKLSQETTERLLTLKAQNSPGARAITTAEIRGIVNWA